MGRQLTRAAGFSLIELLVVVAIMAVLAVGATITMIRPDRSTASTDHDWFQRSYAHNRTLAIHSRQSRGLNVRPNGLIPVRMTAEGWRVQDSAHRWRGRVALAVVDRNIAVQNVPDIVFLATGQTNAFDISFSTGQTGTRRCRSDGWTGLQCEDV